VAAADVEADVAARAIVAVDRLRQRIARPNLDCGGVIRLATRRPAQPLALGQAAQAHAPNPICRESIATINIIMVISVDQRMRQRK
jgi:hypothetical protein